jgi:cobalt/nickel transport system permease protein
MPDRVLEPAVWLAADVAAASLVGLTVRRVQRRLEPTDVPLMGVMAAFIFAAQMLNFPVAGGTSGHLLGGVLAAVLLGPWAGALVIAVVLVVQCLLFQDGGLTALGANIVNMSFVGSACGYWIYAAARTATSGKTLVAAAAAAWCSVVLASAACAVELALSGTVPLRTALPAMVAVHALIGVGEAAITCLVVASVLKVRPDLVPGKAGCA